MSAALRSGRVDAPAPKARARRPAGPDPGHGLHPRPAPGRRPRRDQVPGHWEGDLIIGKLNASAIGTVVERTTGYLLLLHLPDGHGIEAVTAALTKRLVELPDPLRRSLTWDQGKEMSAHAKAHRRCRRGLQGLLLRPALPLAAALNENTNGLLRQYFPKGTDLSVHSAEDLAWVEHETERPAPQTPRLRSPLRGHQRPPVALTARIRPG